VVQWDIKRSGVTPLKVTLFDRSTFAISQREYTPEGFLKVPGRVARTGIQDYLASELGLDGDPFRIIKVYRPEEEVFKDESLETYLVADVTDSHPDELVNSKTFKSVTVGVVSGAGVRDGDYVVAPLVIKDADAIKSIESGKAQLSAGYTAEYDNTPGKTEDGQPYEFIQRDIKINHVAVVDKARAGAMARILDKQPEITMIKVMLDNGRAVEMEDAAAAQVEDSIARLTTAAQTSKDSAEEVQAKLDGLQAQLDSTTEELEAAKKASSDSAILARVEATTDAMTAALKVAGKEFTCDSSNPDEIKRAALVAKYPSKGFDAKPDAYIQAMFDIEMEKEEDESEEEKAEKKAAEDSRAKLAQDMAHVDKDKPSAKQAFTDSLGNRWEKTLEGDK